MQDLFPKGSRNGSRRRRGRAAAMLAAALACGWLPAAPASGQGFFASTHLLDIRQGSVRSDTVRAAGRGGYELADGTEVDLRSWYRSPWVDLQVDFLTQLTDEIGVIWGMSTGERGEKYSISPGLKLGMIYARPLTARSSLSVNVTTTIGSNLRERDCTADYGGIGGVQRVNCRLAASLLPPEETLRHRLRMDGLDDARISVRYELRF